MLDTILLLTGSGLNPLTPQTQQKIVTAMTDVWTPANGITDVTFVQYSSSSQASVAVELYVGTQQGQAPAAAQFMVQSANNGDLANALAKEGAVKRSYCPPLYIVLQLQLMRECTWVPGTFRREF